MTRTVTLYFKYNNHANQVQGVEETNAQSLIQAWTNYKENKPEALRTFKVFSNGTKRNSIHIDFEEVYAILSEEAK